MNSIINNDEFYMRQALDEAKMAQKIGEIPVGAVIVCQNQVIARCHNLTERLHDVTAHAEIQAITTASEYLGGKYLNDCTIYVTLEPCFMCAGALGWSQIGKVVYGAKDKKRGFLRSTEPILHPKTKFIGGILEKECSQLLLDFFKSKR